MALPYTASWTRLTSSGVIGDSGQPVSVQGYVLESGGTASTGTALRSGSAATAPVAWLLGGGVISAASAPGVFGQFPITFPVGCYVSFDANTSAVAIFWFKP